MAVLLQINSGIVGSTGSIMISIDKYAKQAGFQTYIASVNNKSSRADYPENHITIGSIIEKHVHRFLGKFTGNEGAFSYYATRRFLRKVDQIHPDIIQLHNLHWNYINLPILFKYLKSHESIKVVWTLHDCWSYTGHCPYYDLVSCDLWKTECHNCKVYKSYPQSYRDNSRKMHRRKKQWFLGMPNLSLVTPSNWLNNEVEKSFMTNYSRKVISNGIDTKTFNYRDSGFRSRYGICHKFLIMGSAYSWSERKGFDCFIALSKLLDERFQIIMVGGFEKEQEILCDEHGIIHMQRISSKEEMAGLYSTGDVFFNPTREEMFGLVNIEAQACGTPVITFNTGGSPECIGDGCGFVVEKDDLNEVFNRIMYLYLNKDKVDKDKIRRWAIQFEAGEMYQKYITLYKGLLIDKYGDN